MKKRLISLLVVVVIVLSLVPMSAFAGPRVLPYKDVGKKVDSQSSEAISFIKRYNGWRGLIKKGKFYPNKYMTRGEFLRVLYYLYGKKVYADIDDVVNFNAIVTSSFCCERMVKLSKALGYPISWKGYKTRMKRKDVARYIMIFAKFNPKLMPRKK